MPKLRTLIGGLIGAALTASVAQAETWEMPTPYVDAVFHTQNIRQFADDVKAATNGGLVINVHSGGSLFKHPEIKNAVRGGQVPIGEFFLARLSNENPIFGVDTLPFLAANYDQAAKLWAASRSQIEALLDQQGLQVLFAVPWPPQGVYAKKELHSLDDLKGVKFRAYNVATETIARLSGAVPTQIEAPDLSQAFATGRVEAMITSPSTGVSSKSWDVLTHFHHTQAWVPKDVTVVNKKAFARLDAATQKAVIDAAAKAEKRGWDASIAETDAKIAILAENGMKIVTPSETLMAGFRGIGDTMVSDWKAEAGADGEAILEAYGM